MIRDKFVVLASRSAPFQGYGARCVKRYLRTGDPAALDEALEVFRFSAVTTKGSRNRVRLLCLSTFAQALRLQFERTDDPDTLYEAIEVGREALALTERRHRLYRPLVLSNLSLILRAEFDRTGEPRFLREAVALCSGAVGTAGRWRPNRSVYLSNLATAQADLFEQTGEEDLLNGAVSALRAAVAASRLRRDRRAWYLANLGITLVRLFERTGDLDALREAVAVSRAAVTATRPDHTQRATRLSNLGLALSNLSTRTGDLSLLRDAVGAYRSALESAVGRSLRAVIWQNIGAALRDEFLYAGDLAALREAVTAGRAAVATASDDNPLRAQFLSDLGISLSTLFDRTADLAALREAAAIGRAAVAATPDSHPDRFLRQTNLCSALDTLFGETREPAALDEAVTAGRAAVAEVPDDHPLRATCLSNLGIALHTQFEQTGDLGVLREALAAGRDAVQVTAGDDPDRSLRLFNLGVALRDWHGHMGDRHALTEARSVLAEAAGTTTAALSIRIRAGRAQARADTLADDDRAALAAMEAVVRLLPLAASRELRGSDRRYRLGDEPGIGAQAAACALAAGQPGKAVELLEHARGLLMAEAMGSRSELARLRTHAPDLAEEFTRLRSDLDVLDTAPAAESVVTTFAVPDPGQPPAEVTHGGQRLGEQHFTERRLGDMHAGERQLGERRRAAGAAWDALLDRIRVRPGLADFLAPPSIGQLRQQAGPGPIVLLTRDIDRCDALILTADPARPVRHVPLPGCTPDDAFREAMAHLGAGTRTNYAVTKAERGEAQREIHRILAWLWDTIAGPVMDALEYTSRPVGDRWPRLWWCPVGVMSYLPLHAAGHHDDMTAGVPAPRTVLDRVVSSYTATVRVLGYARQMPGPAAGSAPGGAALIVAMPDTPGADSLPGVRDEVRRITALMPGSILLEGPAATRDSVLAALPAHPVAHFACHAVSAIGREPDGGRLVVTDDTARPLSVAAISRLALPSTGLAYLSACSTASPDLSDEAIHITSAFQLAGYRHVIGTLWPVNDRTAMHVAAEFYAELTGDGAHAPATEASALALHHAIRRRRADSVGFPVWWTAHVHTGA